MLMRVCMIVLCFLVVTSPKVAEAAGLSKLMKKVVGEFALSLVQGAGEGLGKKTVNNSFKASDNSSKDPNIISSGSGKLYTVYELPSDWNGITSAKTCLLRKPNLCDPCDMDSKEGTCAIRAEEPGILLQCDKDNCVRLELTPPRSFLKASVKQLEVEGVSLTIQPLPGYCELDSRELLFLSMEDLIRKTIADDLNMLTINLPCDNADGTDAMYMGYVTPGEIPAEVSLAEVCSQLHDESGKVDAKDLSDMANFAKKRFGSSGEIADVEQLAFMQGDNSCYTFSKGVINGKPVMSITAFTAAKGRLLVVSRSYNMRDKNSGSVFTSMKASIADLQKTNK